MIAGEFAVLEPGQTALVSAVDRFVYATLEEATANAISLPDFGLHELLWEWEQEQIRFSTSDVRLDFIANAMETVFAYLREQNVPVDPVHLTVKSELADESGIKYGLGSSAAVVTAAVEAILTRFIGRPIERNLVFKLAAIAHVRTQGSGSGADIAASAYGGLIRYASFQADWLLEALRETLTITALLEREWRWLSIEPLPIPDFVQFLTAWTGTAASTKDLVARMNVMKRANPGQYQSFMEKSKQAVETITQGLKLKDKQTLFEGVTANRHALRLLGEQADVPIETEKLAALNRCAEDAKGAGKLSGAGGGDCGIAFIPLEADVQDLQECWRKNGVKPLDLNMYE